MERTLESVVNQTLRPRLWVIVDDGSSDATPEILDAYAKTYNFIRVLRKDDQGYRRLGGGVVETFNTGWKVAQKANTKYLCKLDMDLDLPLNYFEDVIDVMEADPRLGTFSGKPYFGGRSNPMATFQGELIPEAVGDDNSVGAVKFWRRTAFDQIGGLVQGIMWDGIDCYMMRMQGWRAGSVDDPKLRFIHLRPMGSSDRGILVGRQRHGRGHWFMGSSPIFVLASAIFRIQFRPILIGSLAMLWGYLKAALVGEEQFPNADFRRELRRYQWSAILHGKAGAVRRAEERGECRWTDSCAESARREC
jgi:biofilm PGA synthesis N-glycosyltransferase PgaC